MIKIFADRTYVDISDVDKRLSYGSIKNMYKTGDGCGIQLDTILLSKELEITEVCHEITDLCHKLQDLIYG